VNTHRRPAPGDGSHFSGLVRYEMTVRENIGVGRVEVPHSQDEIEYAAQKSLAADVVKKLDGGYDQMLGRRFVSGVDLSGGEWQKIALAVRISAMRNC